MATPRAPAMTAQHETEVTGSCGYQGYEFGACYPDSLCCDGYLWDADSCDEPGGHLHSGGEIACPRCNTEQFLADALDSAGENGCGESMLTPWCAATQLATAVEKAFQQNYDAATKFFSVIPDFEVEDWPDRQAVYEGRASWEETTKRPVGEIILPIIESFSP